MNRIRLLMIFLLAMALLVVQAQSDKALHPKKVKRESASEVKVIPTGIPERAPFSGSRQGYQMVTDVLDGFGGTSESDNYKIPVNSGGQPSSVGVTQSDNYVIKAGFVHASYVMRGDANADGVINVADIVYLVNFL